MLVGLLTGQVVGFGVSQNICWQCNVYKRKGLHVNAYPKHPCKRNHIGSSASMETSLAVRMQAQFADKGARLSMVVGDCDIHVDAHLNSCPTPELRNVIKCQDLNHMVKNIKKTLMAIKDKYYKGNPKVLTPIMIAHLCSTFTRVVYRHRVDPRHAVVPLEVVDVFSDPEPLFDEASDQNHVNPVRQRQESDHDIGNIITQQINSDVVVADDYGADFSAFDYPDPENVDVSHSSPATSSRHKGKYSLFTENITILE